MLHRLCDAVVEIGWGDSLPPGAAGQHTNCNRVWYRIIVGVNPQEWHPSPFGTMLRTLLNLERSCDLGEWLQRVDDVERAAIEDAGSHE